MFHCFFLIALNAAVVLAGDDKRMPPDITAGSPPKITYRSGGEVRLDCVANGYPKPRFEWKKDGATLDPNNPHILWLEPSVSGTILLREASLLSVGYYQCLATNNYGTAMSNVSFLQMALLDPFTTGSDPVLSHATEGEGHVLLCEQLQSIPDATYSWAIATSPDDKNPVTLMTDSRIQIDSYGNLHFAYVKKEDEQNQKLYKCHIFNSFLDLAIGGSYARLSVNTDTPVPERSPTVAFSTNSPVIGLLGNNVTIECLFYGNPSPDVSWKKANGNLPTVPRWSVDPKNYYTEATIMKLELGDAGDYICTGRSKIGFTNSTITLVVEAKPTFLLNANHLDSKNVTEGESISVTCNSSAIPSASVTWYRNGAVLEKNSLPHKYRLSSDGLNLTITGLCKACSDGSTDLTVIQCNASNKHGYAFAQGSINVILKTVITDQPVTKNWEPKVEVTFPCHAVSDDITPVTHKWFFNDQALVYDNNVMFDTKEQMLYIKTANDSDYGKGRVGTYRCQVCNGYSHATVEHVLFNPTVETASSLWWIAVIFAILIAIIILILLAWIFYQRNKGDTYSVDKKERWTGNDPEKELLVDGFQDYQRTEKVESKKSASDSTDVIRQSNSSLNNLENLNADSSAPADYNTSEIKSQSHA